MKVETLELIRDNSYFQKSISSCHQLHYSELKRSQLELDQLTIPGHLHEPVLITQDHHQHHQDVPRIIHQLDVGCQTSVRSCSCCPYAADHHISNAADHHISR